METFQVRCPLCNRRLFDIIQSSKPPNGTVAVFCKRCKDVKIIDLAMYGQSHMQTRSESASNRAPEPHFKRL